MSRPNFIFIMTDTQGANCLGCYGLEGAQTENLDRLAAQGVRFDRAYTACPLCTPARGAIFTGMTPSVNGAYMNNQAPASNVVNMGRRFGDAGYRTAYIGKWHLDGLDYFDSGICPDGWDDAYWYDGRRYMADLADDEISRWRKADLDWMREQGVGAEFTWAHRSTDKAIRFLESHAGRDEPFLLVVSHDEPHGPSVCPPEYLERFRDFEFPVGPAADDTLENKPSHHHEWAEQAGQEVTDGVFRKGQLYFACNSFVDDEIGRLLDAVDRLADENTVVVYTADHGCMHGAHHLSGKGPAMYEEITRIPLMIRMPGGASGVVVDQPVSHLDLLPTMLELAGAEPVPILHGRSIAPLLRGERQEDRPVFLEFMRFAINHDSFGGFEPIRAIVSGRHKLVLNLLDDLDELYDLGADPHELNNRIGDPEIVGVRDELHDALLERMDEVRDPVRGAICERRRWRTVSRPRWGGARRPRPDDGYMPGVINYNSGKPAGK